MKKTVDIFSKTFQDSLKAMYRSELEKVYSKDNKMVDWCMKQITVLVPICGGKHIIELTKPSIETDFWFGYSDMGQGCSYEENNGRMEFVRRNVEDYFYNENLSGIDKMIEDIKKVLNGKSTMVARHHHYYYKTSPESLIHSFYLERPWDNAYNDSVEMSKSDLKIMLKAYEVQREKFVKRLETYLKKYGSKHLHVSSYWIDR